MKLKYNSALQTLEDAHTGVTIADVDYASPEIAARMVKRFNGFNTLQRKLDAAIARNKALVQHD